SEGQKPDITTARDLAILARELSKNPDLSGGIGADKAVDLLSAEGIAVSFFQYQFLHQHESTPHLVFCIPSAESCLPLA
ncbi:MAG: hypothetical protein P8X39_02325, partial [Desulfofustis sp.]